MNEKLNIQELMDSLAEKHGMSKKNAESFVKEFFLLIEEALENDKYVKVKGLGTFKLIDVESRESVNVNTGERFEIQGHTKVSYTPDPTLKETVNKPFSHFETVVLNESTVLDDTAVVEDEGKDAEEMQENKVQTSKDNKKDVLPVPSVDDVDDIANMKDIAESEEEKEEEEKEEKENVSRKKTLSKEERSTMGYFISIVVFVVVLCVGAVLFMYFPEWSDTDSSHEENSEETVVATVDSVKHSSYIQSDETNICKDSLLQQADADTVVHVPIEEKSVQDSPVTEELRPAEVSDAHSSSSAGYEITGTKTTHTVVQGESLTKISLKYYGTKDLWPYIVKHNPKIKNPDNVPYGTVLQIPELVRK